jgi:hypothetical protein
MGNLTLTELPLTNLKGDLVCILNDKSILFPQITQQSLSIASVLYSNFIDGLVLNEKLFLVLEDNFTYKVIYNNTIRTYYNFAGVVVFGDVIFCFVNVNECLVINTLTDEVKTIIIDAPSGIVYVYQITTFLFAVITKPPTTVYIYSLDDAGTIASTPNGGRVVLPAYTYGVFANPKDRPKLIKRDNLLYLIGNDATAILTLQIQDLVYLRTEATFLQRVSPFPELEEQGIEFIRETQNFLLFRNNLLNNFIWINKGDNRVYFSTNYVYLSPKHVMYGNNLYTMTDFINSVDNNIPLQKEFTAKFKANGLNGLGLEVLETTKDDVGYLSVLSRFLDFENYFNYSIKATQTNYRLALRGEEFVVSLYTTEACRIRGVQVW